VTILCEPDPILAARLAGFIDGPVWTVHGLDALVRALDEHPDEIVIVFGDGVDVALVLEFTSRLRSWRPEIAVVLVCEPDDLDIRDPAIHSGVRDVVATDDLGALPDACRRAAHPSGKAVAGRVVTVFAPTSGYGKTTVATNLAAVLNAQSRHVCLIDLDLAYGDMASVLGFPPPDSADATGSVTRIRAGLDCVLAPIRPGNTDRVVSPDAVGELLAGLTDRYDYVVVDTPAQFCGQVLCALDLSYHHLVVATPERPALRNLRRTLDILDLLTYPREARAVLLNRCGSHGGLPDEDVDALVRNPVAARLPITADVPASINAGVPLAISAPDHPFVGALRRFASTHVLSDREPPGKCSSPHPLPHP